MPAARLLEAIYEKNGPPNRLFGVLRIQRDLTSGPERERILSKMVKVSAEGLADLEASIELYRELFQKNPRKRAGLQRAGAGAREGRAREDLRALLEGKIPQTVDPRTRSRSTRSWGGCSSASWAGPRRRWRPSRPRSSATPGTGARSRRCATSSSSSRRKDDLVIVLRRLIPLQEDASGVKGLRIRLAEVLAQSWAGARRRSTPPAARSRSSRTRSPSWTGSGSVFVRCKAFARRGARARAEGRRCSSDSKSARRRCRRCSRSPTCGAARPTSPRAAGAALEKILEFDPANRDAYEQALKLYSRCQRLARLRPGDGPLPAQPRHRRGEGRGAARSWRRCRSRSSARRTWRSSQLCRALQLDPSDDATARGGRAARRRDRRLRRAGGGLRAGRRRRCPAARSPSACTWCSPGCRTRSSTIPSAAEAALRKILEFDPTNELGARRAGGDVRPARPDKEYIVALEQKLEAAPARIEQRKEILREIARSLRRAAERPATRPPARAACARSSSSPTSRRWATLVSAAARPEQTGGDVADAPCSACATSPPTPRSARRFRSRSRRSTSASWTTTRRRSRATARRSSSTRRNGAALDALERLYTKLDRPAELLAVYERQLELTEDYRERVKILFKSAVDLGGPLPEPRPTPTRASRACWQLDRQNLQAIKTLERLRKAQGAVGGADRRRRSPHPAAHRARPRRPSCCVEMGDIFHQQLKQVDRAVTAYHQALELDARCRPAMHALGMLYERSGNWPFALDMLEQEAQAAGRDAPTRSSCYHRMGKINEDMLIDPGAREALLPRGAADRPRLPAVHPRAQGHLRDREGLGRRSRRRWSQEAEQTEEPGREAEGLRRGRRATTPSARKTASSRDPASTRRRSGSPPSCAEAARPLADIYIAREDWEQARADARHRRLRRCRARGHAASPTSTTRERSCAARCTGSATSARSSARRTRRSPATSAPTSSTRPTCPALEGLRQPAGAGQAPRRGAQGLPDHPHPPPRRPDRPRGGGDLLDARRRPHRAEAARSRRRTTSRRRWPSTPATSPRCASMVQSSDGGERRVRQGGGVPAEAGQGARRRRRSSRWPSSWGKLAKREAQ